MKKSLKSIVKKQIVRKNVMDAFTAAHKEPVDNLYINTN
jgi:hypothetical protein